MNNNHLLKTLKYLTSLGVAFGIIYLLFKNQDPVQLIKKIKEVDGKWVLLSMIFGAWAYVSRGLRWLVLIDALGYKSKKTNSIASVSIGYFTNLFIPRAGEIARCTSLSQTENIPVEKLFGTIIIERVIDFIFLLFLLLLTLFIKFNELFQLYTTIKISQEQNAESNTMLILLLILLVSGLLFFLIKKSLKNYKFYDKIIMFINGLKEGFKSIQNIKRKPFFWFHTIVIWIMYFLMTYICFSCIEETSFLTISDGLFLLVLGGIGMVIPTPGGIGSYHAIVMIGLSIIGVGAIDLGEGGDPTNPALIFPTIVHAAQTLVAVIMGVSGLIILFLYKKKTHVKS